MHRSGNRVACGRRIGMCGYTYIPEDKRTVRVSVLKWLVGWQEERSARKNMWQIYLNTNCVI